MKKVCIHLTKSDVRTPWGFRIQGGRDFNRPLVISRITCQSIADVQGLRCGDELVAINNVATSLLLHHEAQARIVESGTNINLEVLRESSPTIGRPQASTLARCNPPTERRNNCTNKPRRGEVRDIQMSHATYDLKHRSPVCHTCQMDIRGPFIVAIDSCFCPDHCICCCCQTDLTKTNFVEIAGKFYCESDYVKYLAPNCAKCNAPVVENEVTAINKKWHYHCFTCNRCSLPLASVTFKVGDDGLPYCEKDWNDIFQVKCARCNMAITFIDKFVEVDSNAYHVRCFCCSACKISLEGKQFHNRNGKPFCKNHAFAGVMF